MLKENNCFCSGTKFDLLVHTIVGLVARNSVTILSFMCQDCETNGTGINHPVNINKIHQVSHTVTHIDNIPIVSTTTFTILRIKSDFFVSMGKKILNDTEQT